MRRRHRPPSVASALRPAITLLSRRTLPPDLAAENAALDELLRHKAGPAEVERGAAWGDLLVAVVLGIVADADGIGAARPGGWLNRELFVIRLMLPL
jgi:hypothetical protein